MKLLSRSEELLLLAVWRLEDGAYAVPIREKLQEITGKTWSFGALFVSLDRLVKKDYLVSNLAEPTSRRGGRSKRMYRLAPAGVQALIEIRQIEQAIWAGITELTLQGEV